jgi:multicomponent K+:H+ antiporter subunit D
MFAVLTKVGVYAVIRLWTLMATGGPLAGFGADVVLGLGVASGLLGALGMVGASSPSVQASWAVVVSAGTVLSAVGLADEKVLGSSLFYLLPSTIALAVLFLLVDIIQRWRAGATVVDEAPFLNPALESEDINLDDEGEPLVAFAFPASTAVLGLAFVACTLLLAGLPPLSTFLGKVGMLSAAIGAGGEQASVGGRRWIFAAALLTSGMLALLALMRTGIRIFWAGAQRERPRVRVSEGVPVVALLSLTALLAVAAGPALTVANAAAHSLFDRGAYIQAVLRAPVRPAPPGHEEAR